MNFKLFGSLIILGLSAIYIPATAQDQPKTPFKDRIFFGGNLGAAFGTTTYVELSPLVGYKITEKIHAGIGATYVYIDSKVQLPSRIVKYNTSMYGGRLFGRYYILENAFGHAEFEYLNIGFPYLNVAGDVKIQRENVHSIFVGGGYAVPIGGNSSFVIMLLYNLNEQVNTPYSNPIFRIGFNAGF